MGFFNIPPDKNTILANGSTGKIQMGIPYGSQGGSNMAIPEQVQAASDSADKLISEQAAAITQPPGEVDPAAAQDTDLIKPEHTDTVESLTAKVDNLTQQLVVLQGKYNAEIEALGNDPKILNTQKAEIRGLTRQVNDLNKIVSDQQDQIARASVATPAVSEEKKEVAVVSVSDEDLAHLSNEGFTGETMDVFKRLVRTEAEAIAKAQPGSIPESLEKRVESIEKIAVGTENERFFQALTQAVPNWRAINKTVEDPNNDWLDWLDGVAAKGPYESGPDQIRADILHEAQKNLNAIVAIKIFQDYISEKGIKPIDPIVDDPLKIIPADLIEPEANSSGGAPPEKPTYTMSEYKEHAIALTKGHWKGREAEWKERSVLLDAAYAEGRIL